MRDPRDMHHPWRDRDYAGDGVIATLSPHRAGAGGVAAGGDRGRRRCGAGVAIKRARESDPRR